MSRYIKTSVNSNVEEYFLEYSKLNSRKVETMSISELREKMFQFFDTDLFKKIYFEMMQTISKEMSLDLNSLILQTSPTPRIFKPGSHGSSFHCDYWYGHGLKSYTVWTPLMNLEKGNTLSVCSNEKQEKWYGILEKTNGLSNDLKENIIQDCYSVLPPNGSSLVFNTKTIHGSPLNKSAKTRLSFDFRFGVSPDTTSTKDIENYYHFDGENFYIKSHAFMGKKVLKYICGGINQNTFAQHMLIDAAAKRYGFILDAQEAEAERFGHPMLEAYLSGLSEEKGFEGIVIAGSTVINDEIKSRIKQSNIPVFLVLENYFL